VTAGSQSGKNALPGTLTFFPDPGFGHFRQKPGFSLVFGFLTKIVIFDDFFVIFDVPKA